MSLDLEWKHSDCRMCSWYTTVTIGDSFKVYVEIAKKVDQRYHLSVFVSNHRNSIYDESFSCMTKAKRCIPGILTEVLDKLIEEIKVTQSKL